MTEKKSEPGRTEIERRSLTEAAVAISAVATPVGIGFVQPIVSAWANQHFGQDESASQDPPPAQEPEK